jgi:ribosomal protein S27E
MIEQDVNDSFPEDSFVAWTCPECGHEKRVMLRFLEAAQCEVCVESLMTGMDSEWFDLIDPVERDVA